MSEADGAAGDIEPRAPRGTVVLYGHAEAESTLLEAYRSGRFPHAWLITGPAGIGRLRSPIAWRASSSPIPIRARPRSPWRRRSPSTPIIRWRRMAVQAATCSCSSARSTRRPASSTMTSGRRRAPHGHVLRLDAGEADGASPLSIRSTSSTRRGRTRFKVLEEPPRRGVLLVSHSAARVLPTIRSRCRVLALRRCPPPTWGAAAAALAEEGAAADVKAAAAVADGSVRRALALLDGDALDLRNRIVALLERLPAVDRARAACAWDRLYGTDAATLAAFVDTVNGWLSARASQRAPRIRPPRARGGGLGADQPRRGRGRRIQSRAQTAGVQRLRLACRGLARLIPIDDVTGLVTASRLRRLAALRTEPIDG